MIQIRWNSLNYYIINSRFGAANFHEIIDQIFSSIINNVINSIPWIDSSMCFIVDKKKEKKKKKTIKDLDRPINHFYENKEMASFDLGKKIRQRSSHTFFNRVTLIYPAGNLCRLPRSLQSLGFNVAHASRETFCVFTYLCISPLRGCRGREEASTVCTLRESQGERERRTRCQHPR